MNEVLASLSMGLATVLSLKNIGYCLIGVSVGQLLGILPGIGPVAGIALLLPMTYGMAPTGALIMLAGIYYGCMYGGTITSVLLKIPGENSSVITALEGYEMAKAGRAGPALGIAAFGSFIAGILGMLFLAFFVVPLSRIAVKFGSAEYAALMIFALTAVSVLTGESPVKGLVSAVIGLALGTVGLDTGTGVYRFTFGIERLVEGLDFVIIAIGLFAFPELFSLLEKKDMETSVHGYHYGSLKNLLPTGDDWRRSTGPILRGTIIGFLVGILPGTGATVASFLSYGVEKRVSREPHRFGRGAIEGVAGPESANNAACPGAMVPMLAFGIPGSATTAILLSGFMTVGIQPGPLLMVEHAEIVWALIASMIVGNLILLILNIPLIGLSIQILRLPIHFLVAIITTVASIGVLSLRYSVFDLWLMLAFGCAGYIMQRIKMPAAPLLLSLILAPLFERNLRRTFQLGGLGMFIDRPVALALLVCTVLVWGGPSILLFLKRRIRSNQRQ